MANYEQLPGELNLAFRRGDEVSTEIDFSPISLTAYTMAASLVSLVSGGTVSSMTTTMVDAAAGRLNIGLTDEQTAALPIGTYRWDLTANDGTARRSYLTGVVEVSG
jgi:hypothetical protein